jgi:hypothetical protein
MDVPERYSIRETSVWQGEFAKKKQHVHRCGGAAPGGNAICLEDLAHRLMIYLAGT